MTWSTSLLISSLVLCWLLAGTGLEAAPIRDGSSLFSPETLAVSVSALVGLGVLICAVVFLIGCVCCPHSGLKVLGHQNGISLPHHQGVANHIETSSVSEFTIFPPPNAVIKQPVGNHYRDEMVTFEPLPDIRPRKFSNSLVHPPRPAHFTAAVSHGLSLQDWFEESHRNFPRNQLQYQSEVGTGWFGKVVEGEGQNVLPNQRTTRVIVKILREDASPSEHVYFLHEVRPFRDLHHPNILSLFGHCLESNPFLIILEHCTTDLKSFLIERRSNAESILQNGILLNMACNVASALQHMHQHAFVHTDLAARNCLVDINLSIKIGDYGTAVNTFKEDYYCLGDIALPIRWCAPESLQCTETAIETKEVTRDANIWSFGVLLWELLELGKMPYMELSDDEVLLKVVVEQLVKLEQPKTPCVHKNQLYQIMMLCWNMPGERPSMQKIATLLNHLYDNKDVPSDTAAFESRWNSLQPVVQEHNVVWRNADPLGVAMTFESDFAGQEKRNSFLSASSDISSSRCSLTASVDINLCHNISPSLQNLRGSLEDLDNKSRDLEFAPEKSEMQQQEDRSIEQQITAAIQDLDNILAGEVTSSETSKDTTPERNASEESEPNSGSAITLTDIGDDELGTATPIVLEEFESDGQEIADVEEEEEQIAAAIKDLDKFIAQKETVSITLMDTTSNKNYTENNDAHFGSEVTFRNNADNESDSAPVVLEKLVIDNQECERTRFETNIAELPIVEAGEVEPCDVFKEVTTENVSESGEGFELHAGSKFGPTSDFMNGESDCMLVEKRPIKSKETASQPKSSEISECVLSHDHVNMETSLSSLALDSSSFCSESIFKAENSQVPLVGDSYLQHNSEYNVESSDLQDRVLSSSTKSSEGKCHGVPLDEYVSTSVDVSVSSDPELSTTSTTYPRTHADSLEGFSLAPTNNGNGVPAIIVHVASPPLTPYNKGEGLQEDSDNEANEPVPVCNFRFVLKETENWTQTSASDSFPQDGSVVHVDDNNADDFSVFSDQLTSTPMNNSPGFSISDQLLDSASPEISESFSSISYVTAKEVPTVETISYETCISGIDASEVFIEDEDFPGSSQLFALLKGDTIQEVSKIGSDPISASIVNKLENDISCLPPDNLNDLEEKETFCASGTVCLESDLSTTMGKKTVTASENSFSEREKSYVFHDLTRINDQEKVDHYFEQSPGPVSFKFENALNKLQYEWGENSATEESTEGGILNYCNESKVGKNEISSSAQLKNASGAHSQLPLPFISAIGKVTEDNNNKVVCLEDVGLQIDAKNGISSNDFNETVSVDDQNLNGIIMHDEGLLKDFQCLQNIEHVNPVGSELSLRTDVNENQFIEEHDFKHVTTDGNVITMNHGANIVAEEMTNQNKYLMVQEKECLPEQHSNFESPLASNNSGNENLELIVDQNLAGKSNLQNEALPLSDIGILSLEDKVLNTDNNSSQNFKTVTKLGLNSEVGILENGEKKSQEFNSETIMKILSFNSTNQPYIDNHVDYDDKKEILPNEKNIFKSFEVLTAKGIENTLTNNSTDEKAVTSDTNNTMSFKEEYDLDDILEELEENGESQHYKNGLEGKHLSSPSSIDDSGKYSTVSEDEEVVLEDLETGIKEIINGTGKDYLDEEVLVVDTETNEAMLLDSEFNPYDSSALLSSSYISDILAGPLESIMEEAEDISDHSSPIIHQSPSMIVSTSSSPTPSNMTEDSLSQAAPSSMSSDARHDLVLEGEEFLAGNDDLEEVWPTEGESGMTQEAYTPDFESETDETSSTGTSCSSTSGSFECLHSQSSSKEQDEGKMFSNIWDRNATPTKSAIKSPEKISDMKKSVSFHEEDPLIVYSYPPEPDISDDEDATEFIWHVDYSSYADWDLQPCDDEDIPEDIIEFEDFEEDRSPTSQQAAPLSTMMYSITGISDDDLDSLDTSSLEYSEQTRPLKDEADRLSVKMIERENTPQYEELSDGTVLSSIPLTPDYRALEALNSAMAQNPYIFIHATKETVSRVMDTWLEEDRRSDSGLQDAVNDILRTSTEKETSTNTECLKSETESTEGLKKVQGDSQKNGEKTSLDDRVSAQELHRDDRFVEE